MRGLSESIVIFAGAVALVGGALAERQKGELPTFIGVVLIVIGGIAWLAALGGKRG